MLSRLAGIPVVIKTIVYPRDRFQRPGCNLKEVLYRYFCCIHPQPIISGFIKTINIAVIFLAQQVPHLCHKGIRQILVHLYLRSAAGKGGQ